MRRSREAGSVIATATRERMTDERKRISMIRGQTWRHRQWSRAAAVAWLLASVIAAPALEPTTPLAGYGRQSWVMENGLPQNTVQALAQDKQGFVWLGTEVGLVRFDGNSFQLFDRNSTPELPSADVRYLLAGSHGTLWIGTSEGLASLIDGRVTAYSAKEGTPGGAVKAVLETLDGAIWTWTDGGLARGVPSGGGIRFEAPGGELRNATITAVIGDGRGGLRVETTEGAQIYKDGRWTLLEPFATVPTNGLEFEAELANGETAFGNKTTVTVAMSTGYVLARLTAGKELQGSRIQALMADREGELWIGTNAGLARWVGGKLEQMAVTDALASASVLALMEDREGNLWVGTETGGLHILRDQRFKFLGAHNGLTTDATTTVVEDGSGTLWVGTAGGGLNTIPPGSHDAVTPAPSKPGATRIKNKRTSSRGMKPAVLSDSVPLAARNYTVRDGLLSDVILSLAAAPNGDLWVGTPDGLNRIRGKKIDAFTSADGLPDDFIRSLLAEDDGSLWIGTRRGLAHWSAGLPGGKIETFTEASGLGSDLVGAMARDASGDLWVATFAGLSRLRGGRITNYTTADGLPSNVVTALLPRDNGTMLIGTQDRGWRQWDGQKITSTGGRPAGMDSISIHAILEDGKNHLWFATGNGIARCDRDMLGGCTGWIEFGAADGLRSRETATNSHPSAWRSRNGHLWFATPKGVVEVDPAHFPVNAVAPGVALERFAVDDASQPLLGTDAAVRIPAGRGRFEFDYAGLSFVAPLKVRYRYMLEGFDRGWTEAGARRTAYYTNIPPGKYTFRVQAANNDGIWNREGATLRFELRPHFYQTAWFYLVLAVGGAALIVLAIRLRLRRAESEFKAVLGERNRIAREIHDTLAQGYVGISVQLEVLSELLRQNKNEAAAKHLDTTRGYVREGLADARQSIWTLRSQDSDETTLPVRLRRMVEKEGGHGIDSNFSMFGAYRPLPPTTEREILRIAQEAIHNVNKHAGAKHLFVQLEFGPEAIALEVRDDGSGFETGPQTTSPTGHFGLTGMRERATAIGGTLEVTSEPGIGTTVRLRAQAPRDAEVGA